MTTLFFYIKWSSFLNNKSLRGALADLSAVPFYIFL